LNFKRLERLLLTSLLILSLCCCSNTTSNIYKTPNNTNISTNSGNILEVSGIYNKEKSIKENITEYIKRMTLEEKLGQMIFKCEICNRTKMLKPTQKGHNLPNGFLSRKTIRRLESDISKYKNAAKKSRLSIPLLFALDAVHGNNNMKDTVIYPHNIALGATRNGKLVREIGTAVADELNSIGIDWTFSPCVAVSNDIRWGRDLSASVRHRIFDYVVNSFYNSPFRRTV
jgi:beta-glucosidase